MNTKTAIEFLNARKITCNVPSPLTNPDVKFDTSNYDETLDFYEQLGEYYGVDPAEIMLDDIERARSVK